MAQGSLLHRSFGRNAGLEVPILGALFGLENQLLQGGASAREVKAKVVGSTLDGKGEFSVLAVWSCSNVKKHPLVSGKVFLI